MRWSPWEDAVFWGISRGTENVPRKNTPMPLADTAIRAAKPLDKPQKLFDGNGLFLFVPTHGTRAGV